MCCDAKRGRRGGGSLLTLFLAEYSSVLLDGHHYGIPDVTDKHARATDNEEIRAERSILIEEQEAADNEADVSDQTNGGMNPGVVLDANFEQPLHGRQYGSSIRALKGLRQKLDLNQMTPAFCWFA